MLELYRQLDCTFTDFEKEECISIISRIEELAAKVRRYGILSLEADIEEEQNFFFKMGLQLMIDCHSPEYIEDVLSNIILADSRKGSELLSRMVIVQALVSIINGENPWQITHKLAAMLGEEYLKKTFEYTQDIRTKVSQLSKFMETKKDREAFPQFEEFESFMLGLNKFKFHIMIANFSIFQLSRAFYGCSYAMAQKLEQNISINNFLMLMTEWESVNTHSITIQDIQNQIMEKLK